MDKRAFFIAVLNKLGITPSEQAITFLITWSNFEGRRKGAPHGFNPLNTTYNLTADKGMTNYNKNAGYPVKNYSTFEYGVTATANTLKLRYYTNIIALLKSGLPLDLAYKTINVAKQIKTWGSITFAYKFVDGKAAPKTDTTKGGGAIVTIVLLCLVGAIIYNYVY